MTSGDLWVDDVPWLRHLVEATHVDLSLWRKLVRFCPCSDGLVVPASMFRVEIYKWHRIGLALWLPPHLAQHPHVGIAHEYLSDDIQAVRCVDTHNVLAIYKRAFLFRQVVIVIPM